MTSVELTYRPTTQDLADGSMQFHDPVTVTLEDVAKHEGGEYAGAHLVGETPDGRDVVVFAGSDRVRAREADEDVFDQFLGYAERVEVLE
jgi:hypothetical protein